MAITCDPKALETFLYEGKKAPEFKTIPTKFFRISVNCFPRIPIEEASDLEILTLSDKMGIFSFLDHPGEDIYSPSDGNPIA